VECVRKAREASRAASGTVTRPVVLRIPFSAIAAAALSADDKIRYAFVPRQRIDLQDVREKLSQMRQPAPEGNNDANAANP